MTWKNHAQQAVFQEYLHQLNEIEGRLKRLKAEIHLQATGSKHAPVIQALQTMRGVAEVNAVTLVAEVGKFSRFRNPKQLMAYAGLVPEEHSSGASKWKGKITKTGNTYLRRACVEAAWSYRHKPAVKGDIRRRQRGQSPQIRDIAWRAQDRLHRKYFRMISRGKNSCLALTTLPQQGSFSGLHGRLHVAWKRLERYKNRL